MTPRSSPSPSDIEDGVTSPSEGKDGEIFKPPSSPKANLPEAPPKPPPNDATPATKVKQPHPMAKYAVYRSPPAYKTPYNVEKKLYAKRVMLPANITLQREQAHTLTNEVSYLLVLLGSLVFCTSRLCSLTHLLLPFLPLPSTSLPLRTSLRCRRGRSWHTTTTKNLCLSLSLSLAGINSRSTFKSRSKSQVRGSKERSDERRLERSDKLKHYAAFLHN